MKTTLTISIRQVDSTIWRQFRAMCALQGVSATEKVKELIEQATREDRKAGG